MLERNCPKCGSTKMEHGRFTRPLYFKADSVGFLSRGKIVQAYACKGCGHIDLVIPKQRVQL